jgi:preprotein translocase subunit SecE
MKIAWVDTLVNFFKDVKAEMKKVSWPTSQEVWGTTLVTIVATMVLAVYLYFADLVLGRLMQYVYLKLGA